MGKDRNQRRPGRRRSQEEGGGACELPPRAGPAAAKHFLKLQQQQLSFLQTSRLGHRQQQQHLARGRAWRGVATGGDLHHHGDHDLHHRWARHKERQPSEGELLQRAPHITITSLTLSPGRTRPKKEDWLKKKDRKRRPGCRRKKTRKRG